MKQLSLLVTLLLVSATAQANQVPSRLSAPFVPGHSAIIGGTEVQAGDPVAASTVLVYAKEDGATSICTGTIIEKDIILTAAHCLGISGLAQVVVAFRTSLQGQGPVMKVAERRRPTDFLDRAGADADWHDIAVLRIAGQIPAGYKPAKFATPAQIKDGGAVVLAGYGMNVPVAPAEEGASSGSGVLRKVDQVILQAKFGVTETLVSLAGGKGACKGDSGGPAFIKQGNDLLVFGVASRMTEKGRVANNGDHRDFSCSVEMVYSNAVQPSLMTWIQKASAQMRDNIPLHQ
jgi:secreted trypsin-like serine protease